jgi:hypothetical protein
MPGWSNKSFWRALGASLFFFFCGFISAAARNNNFPCGTRSWGMGNASVCNSDAWSMQHNVAGIASLRQFSAGMYLNYQPLFPQLQQYAVAVAKPFSFGSLGAMVSRFGIPQYSELKASFGYARSFGHNLLVGMQLNYLQTAIGDQYGSSSSVAVEAGLLAKLTPKLKAGMHVYNINRARALTQNNERIPTIVRLGLMYLVSEKVTVAAEFEKESTNAPTLKAGMEYRMQQAFVVRGGVMAGSAPGFTFGAGYLVKNIRIDIAASWRPVWGITPHLGSDFIQGEKNPGGIF